jgi:outer membrane protein TolC
MSYLSGPRPAVRAIAATIVVAVVFASHAYAQQTIPLTLAEAEDLALANEPGRTALLARAHALTERSVAAGTLPDPTMRVALNNYPVESGSFTTEGMTNFFVGLHQAFPPGDTRSIDTQRYTSLADQMTASAGTRSREVLAAARRAWLEAYYWQEANRLVSETRPFFDDLAAIARSLYAVGRKNQQDVLRAELELSRLDDRLIDIERQQAQSRAALGQWVGDAARRPIAEKLPGWDALPPRDDLVEDLAVHPALEAADANIAAQQAAADLAEQKYKPGWAVDLGYSFREGYLPDATPRSDMISLQVTVDLPFLGRKSRQDRTLAAALDELQAARDDRETTRRLLASRLDAEYSRWQQIDRRLDLYESKILKQTGEQAEAALVAYQSDRGDFSDVMRGYIDDLNARLDHVRLQVERAESYAALAELGGLPR